MTEERFLQMVEAYGSDPARWPLEERGRMQAFAERHRDIANLALREEVLLDAMLDHARPGQAPGELLERRILSRFPAQTSAPRWQIPVAVAAALLVGAFIGFASGALTVTDTVEATLYADAYTGLEDSWIDWLGDDV